MRKNSLEPEDLAGISRNLRAEPEDLLQKNLRRLEYLAAESPHRRRRPNAKTKKPRDPIPGPSKNTETPPIPNPDPKSS
jgi:hypothetical protein